MFARNTGSHTYSHAQPPTARVLPPPPHFALRCMALHCLALLCYIACVAFVFEVVFVSYCSCIAFMLLHFSELDLDADLLQLTARDVMTPVASAAGGLGRVGLCCVELR